MAIRKFTYCLALFTVLAWTVACSDQGHESLTETTDKRAIPENTQRQIETQVSLRPLRENEKMARCVIKPLRYKGPCVFNMQPGGTFSISKRDESVFYGEVTVVTVAVVDTGKAEVFGLTTYGNNSRWGSATRSEADRACWKGSDFEVCAY